MKDERPGDILIERLKIAARCKGYSELMARLDIKRAWLVCSRKEGKLHPAIKDKLIEKGIDPWWVEFGIGEQHLPSKLREESCGKAVPRPQGIFLEQALKVVYNYTPGKQVYH